MLRAYRNIFWGARGSAIKDDVEDIGSDARWAVILLIAVLLLTGFLPGLLLDYLNPVFAALP
jgi:NADH:ubiquinone oxidoreductase subunit 4 (subunit M)